jgi:hypothetical protein
MNIGMDMAAGEYIGIIESDNYVNLERYEVLYRIAKNALYSLNYSSYNGESFRFNFIYKFVFTSGRFL